MKLQVSADVDGADTIANKLCTARHGFHPPVPGLKDAHARGVLPWTCSISTSTYPHR